MKIIQVHNYYQQAGGEDAVVAAERALLEAMGNVVIPFYKSNDDISGGRKTANGRWTAVSRHLSSVVSLLRVSTQTIWNHQTYREVRALLKRERPDIVHCHNTFPLISPSIYWACAKEGVPVVQTLHNYRLLCLNAFLFRQAKAASCKPLAVSSEKAKCHELKAEGSICELCVSKRFKWPGIKYGCYRDSKAGSLVIALMLFVHKLIGTYSKKVSAHIALTEFQKQKMIEGGLPEGKIFVKPNFIQQDDLTAKERKGTQKNDFNGLNGFNEPRDLTSGQPYALFVGRLSPEKGCDVLIRAWAQFQEKLMANSCELIADSPPQLIIVGDGPERVAFESLTSDLGLLTSVRFLGKQSKERVLSLMRSAQFLVLPSLWYEGFPMTIVEAFSNGLPVVASNIGSMTSVIEDRRTGLQFKVGDPADLAEKMEWAFAHPEELKKMGRRARQTFETNYSAEVNADLLGAIYKEVMARGK